MITVYKIKRSDGYIVYRDGNMPITDGSIIRAYDVELQDGSAFRIGTYSLSKIQSVFCDYRYGSASYYIGLDGKMRVCGRCGGVWMDEEMRMIASRAV